MKARIALLSLLTVLTLLLAAVPASASVVYSNGPINGNNTAWTINNFYQISDSFDISQPTVITGLHIGVWMFPGETLSSVDVVVGYNALGTGYYFTLVPTGFTDIGLNQYGYDIQQIDFAFPGQGITLYPNTYWLTLLNAVSSSGGNTPVYWDENDGPSLAESISNGDIGSEAFWLTDPNVVTPTPEPTSLFLLGTGLLGAIGYGRRRLRA